MSTAFFWDEQSFWHGGGNYVFTVPVGGLVQPSPTASLPESPETKRRLKNLMDVTGLSRDLDMRGADPATRADLDRVHPASYLDAFKAMSDEQGGELGRRTPFGPGGYELAALSAGLAKAAVRSVLMGTARNAYALSRPPGHHCLPDWPNGFCLLNNIAIAIESAMADGLCKRVAVVDWDVHHGNGTEAIFLDRDDVLAISLHQERNYPLDTGDVDVRGTDAGHGYNINIPLPAGAGHVAYLDAFDRIVLPALDAYKPDLIIVACGYDASILDPLSQTLATSQTFRDMTARIMGAADRHCDGKLVLVHEGGYSELHVPFCGHAVLEQMSGSTITAPDPMFDINNTRQPTARFDAYVGELITEMAQIHLDGTLG